MNKIDKPLELALKCIKNTYGSKPNWVWHEEGINTYGRLALNCIEGIENDILDVGYGFGTISIAAHLMLNNVTSVDLFMPPPSFYGIDWLYPVDVQNPEFVLDKKFDVILLLEVLEHFNFDATETLLRLVDMLKPEGKLLIATPDKVRFGEDLPDVKLPTYDKTARLQDKHIRFYDENDLNFLNILSKIEIGPRNLFIIQK